MQRVFSVFLSPFLLMALWPPLALGNEYVNDDFYQIEQLRLDNGLRVILKPRGEANNVAIRLVVNTGMRDFPCGKREVPHFLEHMMFNGTSKHTESELDTLIETNGGSWNAGTGSYATYYEVNIYSPRAGVAIDVLHEIFTDSLFDEQSFVTSRNVLLREMGSATSYFKRLLNNLGIGLITNAPLHNLYPGVILECDEQQTASTVERQDILDAFGRYYTADNMSLILVGKFDRDRLLDRIRATFGRMAVSQPERPLRPTPEPVRLQGNRWFEGVGNQLFSRNALVLYEYRIGVPYGKDYFALDILANLIDKMMYERLRIDEGLAYTPGAGVAYFHEAGIFFLSSKGKVEDAKKMEGIMNGIMEDLDNGLMTRSLFEKNRQSILLSEAMGMESNSDYADYYAVSLNELDRLGEFQNYEKGIASVTLEDAQSTFTRLLGKDRRFTVIKKPLMSRDQLWLLIGGGLVLLAFTLFLLLRHRWVHRRSSATG